MPKPNIAEIIAALPPLAFRPAAEAPVSRSRSFVVLPADPADDWTLARHLEDGWFGFDGVKLEPVLAAALPPTPFRGQAYLERTASAIRDQIIARQFDRAATLVDELADVLRAVRDDRDRPLSAVPARQALAGDPRQARPAGPKAGAAPAPEGAGRAD